MHSINHHESYFTILGRIMQQRANLPLSRFLSPKEAFAEVEYLVSLYDQPSLLLGACQIRFGHMLIEILSDQDKMEVAADVRPALMEIKRYMEDQPSQRHTRQ